MAVSFELYPNSGAEQSPLRAMPQLLARTAFDIQTPIGKPGLVPTTTSGKHSIGISQSHNNTGYKDQLSEPNSSEGLGLDGSVDKADPRPAGESIVAFAFSNWNKPPQPRALNARQVLNLAGVAVSNMSNSTGISYTSSGPPVIATGFGSGRNENETATHNSELVNLGVQSARASATQAITRLAAAA